MKPFVPHQLPLSHVDYGQFVGLVGQANAAVARYDGMLQSIVNPSVLLSPLTTQEAVLSSKIEGTQATLDEVLEHEAGQNYDQEKTLDILEIVNYRTALTLASEAIDRQPLTLSLLQHLHGILMNSVRGQDKQPGEFRKDQNWLGPYGCSIEEATFIPPDPLQLLDHLQAWETYAHGEEVDTLIQAAVVHAQFEILHPFKDGNGRIGRLLIPLFLCSKGLLSHPSFYLSAYLERHREDYYALLLGISQNNDWAAWIRFFLNATIEQAQKNLGKIQRTLALYEEMKNEIAEVTQSKHGIRLLDAIFCQPIFKASALAQRIELPKQTLMPLLRKMKKAGILNDLRKASGQRPAILAFPKLLSITEGEKLRL